MAYIEPNTTIKFLVGVPFDPTYENTMYFATPSEQEQWMLGKALYTFDRNSYQRVSRGRLKVGWVADALNSSVIIQLYNSNYMMFKNSNFENKWFYAFVTNVEYVNNNTVEVSYVIDIVQTWLFQFRFNQCLIEREHTTTDEIGSNLIPENLELGEYIISDANTTNLELGICVVTSFDINGDYAPGTLLYGHYNGGQYFSGLFYNYFSFNNWQAVNTLLESFNTDALINGVVAVFMCPYSYQGQYRDLSSQSPDERVYVSTRYNGVLCLGYGSGSSTGYTPRNKKLLTYPYNFVYVTNNQGASAEYRYEYNLANAIGSRETIEMAYFGTASCNPGLYLWPRNYKGKTDNYEEGITLTGFPLCSWSYDTFKAWLSQNAGTITVSSIASLVGVANFAAGSAAGIGGEMLQSKYANGGVHLPSYRGDMERADDLLSISGGSLGQLAPAGALLAQVYDHYIKPPTNVGNGNGNLQYQMGLMNFMYCKKHITKEYASIIDSFFDMYGYATHRVGLPNLNARPCYSYVKTVGASIDGNLPASVCGELEGIFNKGVRFWKTSATFGSFDPSVNDNRV